MERDGIVPFLDWWRDLPAGARDKVRVRLQRLRELGYELRRPEADFLREGIYELRASMAGAHHRILYFFHGRNAVVVSHGIVKEDRVPPREIATALWRKTRFEQDPPTYTHDLDMELP